MVFPSPLPLAHLWIVSCASSVRQFMVDGKIPEGQAILADLLNEAHELYHDTLELCEDADDCKDCDEDDENDGGKGCK